MQNKIMTSNSSRDGRTASASSNVCPVCLDSGWELYEKEDGGIVYEFAKKCTRCGGNTEEAIRERVHRSGMPSKYNNAIGLNDFDVDIYSKVSGQVVDISRQMNGVRSFIKDFYKWEEQGFGLYIYSRIKGSGKSYLASCICNELMRKYCVAIKYINASDLIDISKDENEVYRLKTIKVLVLDDIGAKTGGVDWMTDILFKIIDYRNNNKLVTLYTSNLTASELPYGERVIDRIDEKAMPLSLPEISVRNSSSQKSKVAFFKNIGLM